MFLKINTAVRYSKLTPAEARAKMAEAKIEKEIDSYKGPSLKHQSWCIANDIIIYAAGLSYGYCKIIIEVRGSHEVSSHTYKVKNLKAKDENWSEIIWRLYTEYYLKYNKDEKNKD